MSDEEWEEVSEKLTKKVVYKIKEGKKTPETNLHAQYVALGKYLLEELKKPFSERKFMKDVNDTDSVICVVRFPKRSHQAYNICSVPKKSSNDTYQWWGPTLPLMTDEDNKASIATLFMPPEFTKLITWENEDEKQLYVLKGPMKEEYNWLDDPKGKYARPDYTFLKEAKAKLSDLVINTIKDIPDALIDRIKYTFNPIQIIKKMDVKKE